MYLILTFAVNYAIIFFIAGFTLALAALFDLPARYPLLYTHEFATIMPAALMACFALFAVSPVGEAFFVWRNQGRTPHQRESDFIEPIFRRVLDSAGHSIPNFKRTRAHFRLCVVDDDTINACAVGRKTVLVNTAALHLPVSELEGVLAHELGHLYHGDAMRLLISYTMSILGDFFISLQNVVIRFLNVIPYVGPLLALVPIVVLYAIRFLLAIPVQIGGAFADRRKELRADRFACRIGYAQGMRELLTHLQEFGDPRPRRVLDRLMQSHPLLADRLSILNTLREGRGHS